ncbi:lipopolysaccharide biosynthesis protein [Nitrosopumilus piranensis]|uniref:Polysaccharide biosynthesis protein n=1 Tax=Nitrosopumilus piranensis TaxID=1582439 RepID=A0A0C5C7N9_9ARCH|nr:hypothetical protein [Nitrosopumilus piranensis]AJM91267.1 Polysaccharide biosynthesis protein [Nitrosopumilus piranensis]
MTNLWESLKSIIRESKNLGLLGITIYSASLISGLFFLYIAPLLGPEKYGELSYLYSISNIIFALCFFGGGSIILIYIPKGVKIFPVIGIISLFSCFIGSVIAFIFLNDFVISLLILSLSISNLATNELLAKQQYKSYSKYIFTQRISFVVLSIGLYHVFDISGLLLGIGLSNLFFIPRIIFSFKESKIDFSLIKPRFKFMLNNYALWITRVGYGYMDRLIISPIHGFEILGNYELAGQIVAFMYIFPIVIHSFVQPRDAKKISTRKVKTGAIILSVLFAVLVSILAPIILPLLFDEFSTSIMFVSIMAFAIIPHMISRLNASRFLGNEMSKIVIIGSGLHLGVLILGIIVLGGQFGTMGLAISFLLSEITEAVFLSLMHKRTFKIFV